MTYVSEAAKTPDFISDKKMYTDYAGDIIQTFFEDEQVPLLAVTTEQIEIRNHLVKSMVNFGRHKEFCVSTIHLAVCFFDIYINEYELSDSTEHQKFVALVTLLLAAKSEDVDDKIPSIKDLLFEIDLSDELGIDLRFQSNYTEEEVQKSFEAYSSLYCKIEFLIFQAIHFNTIRPTPVNFIQAFQNILVTPDDLKDVSIQKDEVMVETMSDLRILANEFVKQLLDTVIYNMEFNLLLPSKVAAAIIATARKMMGIKDFWNKQLEMQLRSTYSEIYPIVSSFIAKKAAEACRIDIEIDECEDCSDGNENADSGYMDSISLDSSLCKDHEMSSNPSQECVAL